MTYADFRHSQTNAERLFLRRALKKDNWGLIKTAARLGLYPTTLRKKLLAHGLLEEYLERNKGPGRPSTKK